MPRIATPISLRSIDVEPLRVSITSRKPVLRYAPATPLGRGFGLTLRAGRPPLFSFQSAPTLRYAPGTPEGQAPFPLRYAPGRFAETDLPLAGGPRGSSRSPHFDRVWGRSPSGSTSLRSGSRSGSPRPGAGRPRTRARGSAQRAGHRPASERPNQRQSRLGFSWNGARLEAGPGGEGRKSPLLLSPSIDRWDARATDGRAASPGRVRVCLAPLHGRT